MRRLALAVIVIAVLLLFGGSYFLSLNYLDAALAAQDADKHDEAEKLFSKSVIFNPFSNRATTLFCGQLFTQQKFPQAEKYCKRALALNKNASGALNYLALTYFQTGQYQKAAESFEKLASLDPQSDFYQERLGLSYYFAGEYDKAISILAPLREKQLRSISTYVALGYMYAKSGNKIEATKVYQEAASLFPDSTPFRHLEAQTYYDEHEYDKALNVWSGLLAQEPENIMWKLGVAISHLGLRHYSIAKPLLEEVVKKDPSIPKAHRSLGAVYYEEKQYQKALTEFLAAEKLNDKENYDVVKYQLGVTYLALGDKTRAKEKLEEYLRVSPYGKFRKDAEEKLADL